MAWKNRRETCVCAASSGNAQAHELRLGAEEGYETCRTWNSAPGVCLRVDRNLQLQAAVTLPPAGPWCKEVRWPTVPLQDVGANKDEVQGLKRHSSAVPPQLQKKYKGLPSGWAVEKESNLE